MIIPTEEDKVQLENNIQNSTPLNSFQNLRQTLLTTFSTKPNGKTVQAKHPPGADEDYTSRPT